MADLTKCQDSTCPKKDTCYRWTAPASDPYQSYFLRSPRVGAVCGYYWRLDDEHDEMVRFVYPETRKD